MTGPGAPKDGDFAAFLEGRAKSPAPQQPEPLSAAEQLRLQQTFHPTEQDLIEQAADREEAEELAQELANPPDKASWQLTDEELERQALEAPGEDGDASTPE